MSNLLNECTDRSDSKCGVSDKSASLYIYTRISYSLLAIQTGTAMPVQHGWCPVLFLCFLW